MVSFSIYIGIDVMCDLPGCVAKAHPLIERRCPDPDRPALVQLVPTPEADMVPVARAAVDRLLESKILLTTE